MVNNKHNESEVMNAFRREVSLKEKKKICRNKILSPKDRSWKDKCREPTTCNQYDDEGECVFATGVDNPNTHECKVDNDNVINVTSECKPFDPTMQGTPGSFTSDEKNFTYESPMEGFDPEGKLVIANHPSLLDVVFIMSMLPEADCIVRQGLKDHRFTRGPIGAAGYISNSDPEMVAHCASSLNSGCLGFLP